MSLRCQAHENGSRKTYTQLSCRTERGKCVNKRDMKEYKIKHMINSAGKWAWQALGAGNITIGHE